MALGVGEVFAGYTVVRQLGAGGMGEVYLAEHPRLPRQDALKILRAEISADSGFRQRFIREADSVAALSHPNIVTVFDRGETDGRLWIATQYVAGTDAAQIMRDRYPAGMPVDEALAIITAIGDALDYAHTRGLLHRDVKPANILLSDPERDGRRRVFLADFGIARPLGDPGGLTATNFTVGTVAYAAPEQLLGADIDGRADQYALAATAFHLLTGRAPFEDSNPVAVISKHLTLPPPLIGPIRPELAVLDAVLSKALAKEPAERYPDCGAFARELVQLAADSSVGPSDPTQQAVPVPTPPLVNRPMPPTAQARVPQLPAPTLLPHGGRSRKKRTGMVAAVATAGVLLGGLAIGFQVHNNHYYIKVEGDGRVAIWHGIFEPRPYALGCIDATSQGELSQVRQVRYNASHSGCDFLRLEDLRPDKRPQVTAGLPRGSEGKVSGQWRDLTTQSLLPLCRLPDPTAGSTPTPGTDCRRYSAG
jgi:serine/threonine-protein kinase